jgi:hypothetical protein
MKVLKDTIWSDLLGKKLLLVALSSALLTHGIILYFTLPKTYDAFVHIFFADHYARFWFEPWEYRWYTGFLTTSYPPLVHQAIALISKIFPLKVAFVIYANIILQILIVGAYRFTKIFFDKTTAGVAALLLVILSSIIETLHVYGQMPTLTGLAFLLNALPFLYQFIVKKKNIYLIMSLVFIGTVISAHHVTAIFGMAFFIAPTIWMALSDSLTPSQNELKFFPYIKEVVITAFKKHKQFILFGGAVLFLAVGLIYPYWFWSKNDPITQVSIPHGSRDNFFVNTSSGLIFYIIPLTLIIALLPAISYSITKQRRFLGWAVAFFLCLLLGSGGTTPLPKMMLGSNAFNILTLDRFGFWGSIIAIPFMAKFILSFAAGPVQQFWVSNFGKKSHFILSGATCFSYFIFIIFIFHLGSFRPLQPKEIEIQPMLNFLNRDDHLRWRYLTLGFGDQMAWLSANSLAATVDGNYHSARRLPELTSRPIERLENAKFSGQQGLASLNDFLANAEKYNLKYIFSNDRYYDPVLYYTGWSRTIRLENGIMVWEKGNISTIKPIEPKKLSPLLKKMWGILPISTLSLAILLTLFYLYKYKEDDYFVATIISNSYYPKSVIFSSAILPLFFSLLFIGKQVYELLLVKEQDSPTKTVLNFYNHLDFQEFEKAFHFFTTSPTYTIDQYLLEKSVNDGGLLPSYAKLDSISTIELKNKKEKSTILAYIRWRTSLGYRTTLDTLQLNKIKNKWYIDPKKFVAEIPDEQIRSYTFTLFKKQGKRVISSFPTVKDDRIKKPFAAYKQVNFVHYGTQNFIVGELLNSDDIPINIALKARLRFKNNITKDYYPNTTIQYNLSPKSSTYFKIPLENQLIIDALGLESIELYTETDISERGYIHGGTINYLLSKTKNNQIHILSNFYNELSTEINIPGYIIAEKNNEGQLVQVNLNAFKTAIRSGLHRDFESDVTSISNTATVQQHVPTKVFINGQERNIPTIEKSFDTITIIPHCFISQEIYLQ